MAPSWFVMIKKAVSGGTPVGCCVKLSTALVDIIPAVKGKAVTVVVAAMQS